jgi:hypothetical protein
MLVLCDASNPIMVCALSLVVPEVVVTEVLDAAVLGAGCLAERKPFDAIRINHAKLTPTHRNTQQAHQRARARLLLGHRALPLEDLYGVCVYYVFGSRKNTQISN